MNAIGPGGPARSAAPARSALFTIGHSNHPFDLLTGLLRMHAVRLVIDVRSDPYSRYNPQYNREALETGLCSRGLDYLFLGRELGARRHERSCYVAGVARYELIAKTPGFSAGLDRVRQEAARRSAALLCAEKDPLTCHRAILVCRRLRGDLEIRHIREDGALESLPAAEERLLRQFHPDGCDLFSSRAELVEDAYERQAARIQYVERPESDGSPATA